MRFATRVNSGLGAVAQMGERCNRTAEVRGSIPLSSTSQSANNESDIRQCVANPLNLVAHWRRFPLRIAEKRQHMLGPRLPDMSLQKVGGGLNGPNFLCDCGGDPLVQGHPIFLGQPRFRCLD